jgi:hypothetical protein
MSTIKLAYRLTFVNVCFAILHNIPLLILTEIHPIAGCKVYNTILNRYYSFFYYPIVTSALPLIVTITFSSLAYRNVRRIVRRQMPILRRRLDRQLTAMILARVICLVTLGLPYVIYSLCQLNININENDSMGLSINRLIGVILVSLFYANYSINFYIYFAISSRFRHQVKYFFTKKFCRYKKLFHPSENQVVPENLQRNISIIDLD